MYLDPDDPIEKHGARLPHWQQGQAMQFVTFRLADAMPESKLRKWREERDVWLQWHPKPWSSEKRKEYHRRFTKAIEDWLDQGEGSCLLKNPANREVVERTLMNDQAARAEHECWVIMPNHVHLLFTPKRPLPKLIKTWKGVSARRIGQGSIWQKNYRDTLIRDSEHYKNVVRYIRKNPGRLPDGDFTLWKSNSAKAVN